MLLVFLNPKVQAQAQPAPGVYDFETYPNGELQASSDTGEAIWNNPLYGLTFIAQGTTGASIRISTVQFNNSISLTFDRTSPDVEVREIIVKSTGISPGVAGGNFKLNSLIFAVLTTATRATVNFKAYKDGVYLGDIEAPANPPTGYSNLLVNFNPYFYNIDEVRISGFPTSGLRLDNINLAAASNYAPVITSGNKVSVPENTVIVPGVVKAFDYNGDIIKYSLPGGIDQSKFLINENTGELSFKQAPDFENPTDDDLNNEYVVIVRATDNGSPNLSTTQTVTVIVTNVMQGVQSITRADPNPTIATEVRYTITFEGEPVNGVTAGNFAYTTTGALDPNAIKVTSISPVVNNSQMVTLNIGPVASTSTLRLDIANSNDITPTLLNVPYTSGEVYTINPVALPVELLFFKATGQPDRVLLQWATASELENKGFDVQRSADGRQFTTFAFVEGAGTSSNTTQYNTIDRSPLTGISYYRLRQVDFSGKAVYSKIIAVNLAPAASVQIAPNPVQDKTTVSLRLPTEQTCTVRLIDAAGRTIYTRQIKLQATDNFVLDFSAYPVGMYFLTIQGANHLIYQGKLLKN